MKVAIIGASSNREKFGNKAVRSHLAKGHHVFPVNPTESAVEGLQAYKSVRELPEVPDRALLYVPPQVGITVLEAIADQGIKDVYVNPGAGNPALMQHGKDLGLNMIQDCAIIAIGDSPANYR